MDQVLTANRLTSGDVTYWSATRGWVGRLADADVLNGDAETVLARAQDSVKRREVVNPYLFTVRVNGGRIEPVKEREVIRAAGPTVRRDLGKQAA